MKKRISQEPLSQEEKERRKKRAELRKDNRLEKDSRQVLRVGRIFTLLFLVMICYLGYYILAESEKICNNSYNVRLQDKEKNVYRGPILSADGQILAETVMAADGTIKRQYPFANVFAHAVGYSTVGITGIEKMANSYLLKPDSDFLMQDLYQQWTGDKFMGCSVVTTLDTRLQQIAYDQLSATGQNGAVVALDPSTGKVLAMVSLPDFDPNTIVSIWDDLIASDSGDSRLVNRATQGLYPPGSTFKVLTALEYLRENPLYGEEVLYQCEGSMQVQDQIIHCSENAVHGEESLRNALANSCNTFFATIGNELNTESFQQMCRQFLFDEKMPYEMEYKKSQFALTTDDSSFQKMQTMFGQGNTLVTPMHMAMIAASVANSGTMMTPYLIDRIENSSGKVIEKYLPQRACSPMTADEAERLTSYMVSAVSEGTGYLTQSPNYQSACKTGSAEYDSTGNTHAWYIGFAPAENPSIAVAVIVEKGGSGGRVAAPIAKALYDDYLLR